MKKEDRRRILRRDLVEASARQFRLRQGGDEVEIDALLAEEEVAHRAADEEDPLMQLRREEGAQGREGGAVAEIGLHQAIRTVL